MTHRMDDETWLVWQLVDSALPTGGFVASGGLETAFQLGQVITSAQLDRFIRTSVHSYAHAALPFVTAAYHSTGLAILPPEVRPTTTNPSSNSKTAASQPDDESLQPLVDADHLFHALNPHLSVRRASIAQGTSMITLFLKSFAPVPAVLKHHHLPLASALPSPSPSLVSDSATSMGSTPPSISPTPANSGPTPAPPPPPSSDIAKRFKALIRVGTAHGHFPVCFGLTCRLLQLSLTKTQQLFLFMFVRQIVSSAIRLNIVGPYQAQVTLATAKGPTDEAIHMTADLTMDQATQTSPALDLLQGAHDRLYSRIFNS
ncbi:hypothetical protein H4R33_004740 [Dimargaris cristalligena]|nr:hypothetical protein H4R33_004740 [Dimargaris cristalligena]